VGAPRVSTPRPGVGSGVVDGFDDEVGLGVIRADDGCSVGFHCTQVAGGSRHVDPGTRVVFSVVAGRGGRWEAAGVTPA
jgi:cold shock CspA family protein